MMARMRALSAPPPKPSQASAKPSSWNAPVPEQRGGHAEQHRHLEGRELRRDEGGAGADAAHQPAYQRKVAGAGVELFLGVADALRHRQVREKAQRGEEVLRFPPQHRAATPAEAKLAISFSSAQAASSIG